MLNTLRGFTHRWSRSSLEAAGSGAFGASTSASYAVPAATPLGQEEELTPAALAAAATPEPVARGEQPRGSDVEAHGEQSARNEWSSADRERLVERLQILALPSEQPILKFLADAIWMTPMPVPWAMRRSKDGEVFFVNKATRETTWKHPLKEAMRELVDVCRVVMKLAPDLRRQALGTLQGRWEAEIEGELAKWYEVKSSSGRPYYAHRETGQSVWEHPSRVLLPAHFLKTAQVERLKDDNYLQLIGFFGNRRQEEVTRSPVAMRATVRVAQTFSDTNADLLRLRGRQLHQGASTSPLVLGHGSGQLGRSSSTGSLVGSHQSDGSIGKSVRSRWSDATILPEDAVAVGSSWPGVIRHEPVPRRVSGLCKAGRWSLQGSFEMGGRNPVRD
jgi:hypothetical protein